MPTTIMSAEISSPDCVRTALTALDPRNSAAAVPNRTSTPAPASRARTCFEITGETARASNLSPISRTVTPLPAAAIVAARILADRPFEGIGQELNETLLGDLDDDARAAMNVRSYLGQQPHVMAMLATHAGVATHLNRVKQALHEIDKDRQHGTSVLNQEFPVNGMLDMLILRLWESIGKGAAKHHLAEKLDETTKAYATYATKIMANPNVLSNDRANRMRSR